MKNKTKSPIITLIVLISLSLTISSCGGDDDVIEVNSETLFEVNENSLWKHTSDSNKNGTDDYTVYLKFNDNLNEPIELWRSVTQTDIDDENWCLNRNYYENVQDVEVLHNTNKLFSVKVNLSDEQYEIIKIRPSNNEMTVEIKGYHLSELSDYFYPTGNYNKTTDNILGLNMCN